MNNNEFDRWRQDFGKHYPETQTWLEKQGADTIRTWRDSLADCLLADAIDATAQCHRGDGPTINGPSQWPQSIRQLCKEREGDRREIAAETQPPQVSTPRFKHGEETYRCLICRDTDAPTVLVLSPFTVRQLFNGAAWNEVRTPIEGVGIGTVAVACSCERGLTYADRFVLQKDAFIRKPGKLPVYDPGRMFRVDSVPRTKPEGFDDWLDGLRSRRVERMDNFEPAFDNWNERKPDAAPKQIGIEFKKP